MKNKLLKKIFSIISIILVLFSTFANFINVQAVNIGDNVQIVSLGECDRHVQYLRDGGVYKDIVTYYVGFYENGVFRPAYCLEKDDHGVDDDLSYNVNIQDIYNRDDVWRVLFHGFPYNGDLGLGNDANAFFVTKQAIYAVLDGRDVSNYHGKDAQGIAMVNKIIELVNYGKYGTDTRRTPVIDVTTIKDASIDEKDSNYVSQVYQVDSPINSKDIRVYINKEQAPNGSEVTNMNNQVQTNFNKGDTFKVLIPRQNITDDVNIDIAVTGSVETYPVLYSQAPNSDWQDYALVSDPFVLANSTAKMKYIPHGQFDSTKLSKDYNQYTQLEAGSKLKDAIFEIERIDGKETYKKQFTTNELGKINQELKLGKYKLTEIKAPDYYVINGKEGAEFEFTLKYDGQQIYIDIENNNVILKVDVEKTGTVETTLGGEIEYDFDIQNKSNVPVTNMVWGDILPSEIKTKKLITGIFNGDNTYEIQYITNNNTNWRTLATCNTKENNEFDISNETLGLSNSEYIAEIRFVFDGEIQKYFKNDGTKIFATANSDLKNNQIVENHTYITADYLQTHLEDKDEFHTIVKEKNTTSLSGVLPRTGK